MDHNEGVESRVQNNAYPCQISNTRPSLPLALSSEHSAPTSPVSRSTGSTVVRLAEFELSRCERRKVVSPDRANKIARAVSVTWQHHSAPCGSTMKSHNDLLLLLFSLSLEALKNRLDHHSRLFAKNPANSVGSRRLASGRWEMRRVIPD